MTTSSANTPLYRSRNGWFLGVCRGFAEWRNVPVWTIRLALVLAMLLTTLWPVVVAYIIVGMLMKPEPEVTPRNVDEMEFYDAVNASRKSALKRLQKTFEQLDRRTRKLENIVTSKEFQWEQRLREGR